jgi:hypothetical protein
VSTKECTKCGRVKPLDDFSPRAARCKECRAAHKRERQKEIPPEERNKSVAAFRAGLRKDMCAVCRTGIKGTGICVTCAECVEVLGGLEGLKRAVKAVRFLETSN